MQKINFLRFLFHINKERGWGIVYISSSIQKHYDKYIVGLYLTCISWTGVLRGDKLVYYTLI